MDEALWEIEEKELGYPAFSGLNPSQVSAPNDRLAGKEHS